MIFLSACKGGDDSTVPHNPAQTDNSSTPISTVVINAANTQVRTIINEPVTIDLKKSVQTSDQSGFKLQNVSVKNGNGCHIDAQSTDYLTVSGTQTQDCIFQYRVASLSSPLTTESAVVRLAVASTYSDNTLSTLSYSMQLSDGQLSFNPRTDLPAGSLTVNDVLSESVTVLGSGTAISIPSSDTITYTPVEKGSVSILYSYIDSTTDEIKQGSAVIAISDSTGNSIPTADRFTYTGKQLNAGEEITFDLGALGNVSGHIQDNDGDDLQLIDVQAMDATVALNAPDDVTNTAFSFSSTRPGGHDIIYTITDHRGGFASGILHVVVTPEFNLIQDWDDIKTNDPALSAEINPYVIFSAPLTKPVADFMNINYAAIVDDSNGGMPNGGLKMVAMSYQQAKDYCELRNGRLPLSRELQLLLDNAANITASKKVGGHNWPVGKLSGKGFWTADKSSETLVDVANFNSSTITQVDIAAVEYVTCVRLDSNESSAKPFSWSDITITFDYGIQSNINAILYDPDGNPAPYQNVDLSLALPENGLWLNNNNTDMVYTDFQGVASNVYYDVATINETKIDKTNVLIFKSMNLDVAGAYTNEEVIFNEEIDVTNPQLWQENTNKTDGSVIDDSGLPIHQKVTYRRSAFMYNTAFSGSHFYAHYTVSKPDPVTYYGSSSFYLQQLTPDLTVLLSNGEATSGGRATGQPNSSTVYGFSYSYFQNASYNFIDSGQTTAVVAPFRDVKNPSVNIWFYANSGFMDIYINPNSDIRPETPAGTLNISNLDLNRDFWVGFSGYNSLSTSTRISSFQAFTYDLPPGN
ncbi:hypothetical protein KDD30_17540 (plasmid) [Photobacterium sp. GJ3]|uniref:hypothetical protein n=1 Tax=Photobacterium sp. GJ3 TaxID=2829502 RepID=UPI001B8B27B8|nr:hypothetical protein [Photobacterium sp. GJ3]QUJ69962.1 hypothetical protein KDD30_17540 [Photobacterium sp. GJ3]